MIADLKQRALFSSYSHADDKNTGEPTEEATAIAEICRCLALFTKPGQKVELRAFTPSAATTHGTDHKKLAAWALRQNLGKASVCFTPNPFTGPPFVDPKGKAVGDKDTTRRIWLLLDIDPTKPSGAGSATDDEKEHAKALADVMAKVMEDAGFCGRIFADSGNGFYNCYPIDMPNDTATEQGFTTVYTGLKRLYDTEFATIDKAVGNPSRLLKLFGTKARKGKNTKERPHRISRIIEAPEQITQPMREQNNSAFLALVRKLAPPIITPKPNVPREIGYSTSIHEKFNASPEGQRRALNGLMVEGWTIVREESGGSLQLCRPGKDEPSAVSGTWNKVQSKQGNPLFHCFSTSAGWDINCSHSSFDVVAKVEYGGDENAFLAELKERDSTTSTTTTTTIGAKNRATVKEEWVHDVEGFDSMVEIELDWLWENRIPFGSLTTIEGAPKVGKSTLVMDLLARLSRGDCMPLMANFPGSIAPGKSLILAPEDQTAKVVLPRLRAAGADLAFIKHYKGIKQLYGNGDQPFTMTYDQIKHLEDYVFGHHIRCLFIDAIMSVLPDKVDSNSDNGMRTVLLPLVAMAERQNCAIMVGRHFCKGAGDRSGIERGIGSTAFTGVVRSVIQIGKHPENPDLRIMGVCGSNSGEPVPPMSFTLEKVTIDKPGGGQKNSVKAVWGEFLPGFDLDDIGRAPALSKPERATDVALEWLESRLQGLERIEVGLIDSDAKTRGISRSALAQAKTALAGTGAICTRQVERKHYIFPQRALAEDLTGEVFSR